MTTDLQWISRYDIKSKKKEKINTKKFYASKETISKMNISHRREKMFSNHTSDKGLVSKIYKPLKIQ